MTTFIGENPESSRKNLDSVSYISGIDDRDAALRQCVSVILMSRPADIPRTLAALETVIGFVREARTALDKSVADLDHEPTGDALGYANEMMTGLDTTLITLDHLSRTLQVASKETALHEAIAPAKPKPFLHVCEECGLAYLPNWEPHECDGHNAFHADALDELLGFDGYRVRYADGTPDIDPDDDAVRSAAPVVSEAPNARAATGQKPEFTQCSRCRRFMARDGHNCWEHPEQNAYTPEYLDKVFGKGEWIGIAPVGEPGHRYARNEVDPAFIADFARKRETEKVQVRETVAAPRGMRDGSKKHKIYVATRKLLEENGEMHIDEMLKSMTPGLFSGVSNPRANFANMLSAFRSNRLVLSDNKGNYRLPNGKAAG